jgi:hypothetical protein
MTPAIKHFICTFALVMFVAAGSPQSASAQDSGATPVLADKSPVAELAFWNTIKESQNAFDYKTYLENFPDGMFYDQALERFENAGGKKSQLSVLPAVQTPPDASTPGGVIAPETPAPPPKAVVKKAPAKTKKSALKSKKSKKQAVKHKKKHSTTANRKSKNAAGTANANCKNGRASDGTCLPPKSVTKHRRFHLLGEGGDSGGGNSGGSHSRGGGWGG